MSVATRDQGLANAVNVVVAACAGGPASVEIAGIDQPATPAGQWATTDPGVLGYGSGQKPEES